jgi:transcription initiation factor TFIIB
MLKTQNLRKVKYTKKKKNKKKIDNLWTKFDDEKLNERKKLEVLYTQSNLRQRDICDLCHSTVAYLENKLLSCTNTKCGTIYKDVLDESAEWRYYGADDSNMNDPTRCGMPINPLLKESSYGCKVVCNSRSTYEMRKIRRYTEWQSMPYKEKSQYDEFEIIKIMSHNSGIPKIIVDEALRQHKKLSEMKTFRGCNRDAIIAASVYVAGRIHNYPRTAKEIATIFHLDNTSATKGCKNAMCLLNKSEKDNIGNDKTHFHQTKPTSFIERYASRLNFNKELTMLCKFVAKKIEEKCIIPENSPPSVAAGIVYFIAQSCNLNVSKKTVHNCSEISEVTINKCYKKLEKFKDDLIPSCILNKYN